MEKKIVVLSPYSRDVRELSRVPSTLGYSIIYDEFIREWLLDFEKLIYQVPRGPMQPLTIQACVEHVVKSYQDSGIDGVFNSDDYPASTIASIVSQQLGVPGPRPELVLACEHKYYSRKIQQKYVPEAVPEFHILDKKIPNFDDIPLSFPLFMKPAKSYFSVHAHKITSHDDLKRRFETCAFPPDFLAPFDAVMRDYFPEAPSVTGIMLESCLEGHQLTLEGCIQDGNYFTVGIVDSVMYPGTISFERFEYPSGLSCDVQARVEEIARRLMLGIGFNNSFFNIEFFYNPKNDTISIIEINPRMASQFADLYEKVDGINSYQIALDVAVGRKPIIPRKQGRWKIAASCVLRMFENKRIVKLPSQENIDMIYELFADVRLELFGSQGQTLAELLQDSMSYRYGLVHLGGQDKQDLLDRLQICKNLLNYSFTSL